MNPHWQTGGAHEREAAGRQPRHAAHAVAAGAAAAERRAAAHQQPSSESSCQLQHMGETRKELKVGIKVTV